MKVGREQARVNSVYWMESSKRRQALEWLKRRDLTAEERRALEAFAARYRTGANLAPGERRALLATFDRVGRRLRAAAGPPRHEYPGRAERP